MIKDTHELNSFGSPKFPKLKGHIKVTLHNVHNGKNEVYEGDNVVTNAVQDIASANFLGALNYANIFGSYGVWKKFFGGVLLYESAHPNLDADKYYPQADTANHLTAHAGQTSIDPNHDDDLRRGNPVGESFLETADSVKQVFEWGTSHGNGNISAISLTHTDTGDVGLGSATYAFQNFSPFATISGSNLTNVGSYCSSKDNIVALYDDNHGISYHIGEPSDWYSGHTRFQTDKITVYIRKYPYNKFGLFETMTADSSKQVSFTIEDLPFDLFCQPCFYFEPSTKYLWIFSNLTGLSGDYNQWFTWDNQHIRYFKIDTVNQTLVDLGSGVYYDTLDSDTANLVPICYVRRPYSNNYRFANIVIDESGYAYFPFSTQTASQGQFDSGENFHIEGLKKIKVSTGVTSASIAYTTELNHFKPMIKHGDLFIQSGMVINGSGYPCVNQLDTFYGSWAYQTVTSPSMLVVPNRSAGDSISTARYILANKMLNTTKYNLPSTVQKTPSQSMVVEYTLQEVAPNE